jgi:hypothetical protein
MGPDNLQVLASHRPNLQNVSPQWRVKYGLGTERMLLAMVKRGKMNNLRVNIGVHNQLMAFLIREMQDP